MSDRSALEEPGPAYEPLALTIVLREIYEDTRRHLRLYARIQASGLGSWELTQAQSKAEEALHWLQAHEHGTWVEG